MKNKKLLLIAGPCIIENKALTFSIAEYLKDLSLRYSIDFIFKASYDKANRTSLGSFRGPGPKRGLAILADIKRKLKIRIISDVHSVCEVKDAASVLDCIQIPAFLARQTDLIVAAARTKRMINLKKAQFMSPDDMRFVVDKVISTGNRRIFLTERGTCFGYNNLVVDFRSFLILKQLGYPVIYDVTHSLQKPSAVKGASGGDGKFALPLALGAVASGVDGLFIEVHPNPKKALSDKATSFPLHRLGSLLEKAISIRKALYEKD